MARLVQLLLVQDVDNLGRSGDVVNVKPGYSRNCLLPQKKGVVADPFTLRMRSRLQEERVKRAVVDKTEADALAAAIQGMELTMQVKVDPDGNLYGSVSIQDILHLFAQQGIALEKRNLLLPKPIKELGSVKLQLRLKEGVSATCTLHVCGEGQTVANGG